LTIDRFFVISAQRRLQAIEKWNLRRVYFPPRNFFRKKFRAIDLRKLFQFS
jgi:hypothetical protein